MKKLLMAMMMGAALPAAAGERTNADEATIQRVCALTAPVLVVDTFPGNPTNVANIDLDGDGTHETYHGDFVARIIELHGQHTIRENVGTPVMPAQLLEVFQKYIARLERGEKIAWINYSQGYTLEFDYLNRRLGLRREITEKNVHLYARRILEAVWTSHPEQKVKELYEAFARLGELGVPVILAAANSGFNEVNVYSLFPNVISVGGYDNYGKAPYSADNSAVTIWRTGNIYSGLVPGGIDLNADGVADFPMDTPEIPLALLKNFEGRFPREVARSVPKEIDDAFPDGTTTFAQLVAHLPEGLYSTSEVLDQARADGLHERYLKSLGEYFYVDGHFPRPLFFMPTEMSSGRLRIRQGRAVPGGQYRNVLYGTSFSSPSVCDGTTTPVAYAR